MSYGNPAWQGWVLPEEEGIKHIKAAYDARINAFDTANVYSNGQSEIMLGKAIKEHNLPREEIVVMTKVFFTVAQEPAGFYMTPLDSEKDGYVNQHGLSRKHIFDSVKHSLERLQLDYIDVLQCHRFDPETPVSETMQALHDVVKAGYVRYIGMSSCYAWQLCCLCILVSSNKPPIVNYAIQHNLTPFISMQNHHSLLYREEEREMFPALKHFGVGSIPWSPLARGMLTRPIQQQTKRTETDPWATIYKASDATEIIINRVEEIAKKRGISMAQVAVSYSMGKEGISAPIVGTTSVANLKDLIGAIEVTLTDEEVKYLEVPYKPLPIIH
ncbi:related to voltage-gated potassium channel subunit beta-1 channel subunit beta-1) [Armillaria ostoyae]|uniref:Related to voltage-gated potassium channel subunit beta-1 channel subunit beta-1 n=1 Tax=Armillaria ostoyae TaxID=47428 RepID=A0A284QR78_ARMOS|nr:related to voltage-gated potassium channel subunit beta-1 channel subunit beta-1) [Armillaria ostoyae]